MKTKSIFLVAFATITMYACNNQTKQQESNQTSKESTERLEHETAERSEKERIAQEANERAERERAEQETVERAEKERIEQEEAIKRASEWMGAESVEELAQKIEGTTWSTKEPIARYGGLIYKFEFSNGIVKKYYTRAVNGGWTNDYIAFPYEIKQKRDSNGVPFAAIYFGDGSDLDHANQSIAFIGKHCTKPVWFFEGNPAAELKFGDYKWDNEL